MEFLIIFVKAIVITFFIYGVVSFIYAMRDERARRKTNTKQPAITEQVDLNPIEFPISAYTEQKATSIPLEFPVSAYIESKATSIPPSYKPRSVEDMELS